MAAWPVLRDLGEHAPPLRKRHDNGFFLQYELASEPTHSSPFGEAFLGIVRELVETTRSGGSHGSSLLLLSDEYTNELCTFLSAAPEDCIAGILAATQLQMDLFGCLHESRNSTLKECKSHLDSVIAASESYSARWVKLERAKRIHLPPDIDTLKMICNTAIPHCFDKNGREGWNLHSRHTNGALGTEPCFVPHEVLTTIPTLASHIAWSIRLIGNRNAVSYCNSQAIVHAASHIHKHTSFLEGPANAWHHLDAVVA